MTKKTSNLSPFQNSGFFEADEGKKLIVRDEHVADVLLHVGRAKICQFLVDPDW